MFYCILSENIGQKCIQPQAIKASERVFMYDKRYLTSSLKSLQVNIGYNVLSAVLAGMRNPLKELALQIKIPF